MDAKTEYELDYWRKVRTGHEERYRAILELWGLGSTDSVLEIGTGPIYGCLPYITARLKVGIDPLYSEYFDAGLLARPCNLYRLPCRIEAFSWPERFSAILSMNALDHGDCDFCAIDRIAESLAPRGRFYLHVHLRRPDQLNVGHDHALRLEDLDAAIERNGLREIKRDIYERDPVEGCAYKTVIGVWEKC